jgi:hypothetical protein
VRIIAACALALAATSAVAENLVLNDPIVHYGYTFETRGSLHFCDFSTAITKPPLPMFIKLTAAFVTDDRKPKDNDLTVAYIVEASVVRAFKPSLDTKDIKVVAGRIVSDIFNSDLQATKNVDKDLGASYNIPSEGALALFTNLLTMHGAYTLVVELENNASLTINIKPTSEMLEPSEKWMKCNVAIMEHRKPQ